MSLGNEKGCDITVFNEIGDCFTTGICFGFLTNFAKGFAYVKTKRFKSGFIMVRDRAPLMGGMIGVWGTLYHVFYCILKNYRKTGDLSNIVYSGFLVSVVMNIRTSGLKAALESGIISGMFLLIICGIIQAQNEALKKRQTMQQNIEYTKAVNEKNRKL